jgi:nicotinamide mononucleotide adenylyltransferase
MAKNASVFRGRFQGVTKAHKAIVELIRQNSPQNKTIILIVDGKKTSSDKLSNPFLPQVRS